MYFKCYVLIGPLEPRGVNSRRYEDNIQLMILITREAWLWLYKLQTTWLFSLSLSPSDCWLYCSQLWCRSCGIQIASVISSEALCAWPAYADIRYKIDRSPPSPHLNHPTHPRVACSFLLHAPLPILVVGIVEDCGIDCLG